VADTEIQPRSAIVLDRYLPVRLATDAVPGVVPGGEPAAARDRPPPAADDRPETSAKPVDGAAGSGTNGERHTALVEIVIPVFNEDQVLAASVRRLHEYLLDTFPYSFQISIADNGSTDATWEIATRLAGELDHVRAVRIGRKGRGGALRQVWSSSGAEIVSYMDVDLSSDLDAFLPLVAPLLSGHSDLAIGTRHLRGASVARSLKRAVFSRGYNLLLRTTLGARFSDAQCGFKAGRAEVVRALMPVVEDDDWFFDTELLLVAERHDLRIHEVPVDFVDDPDSKVDVLRTALDDVRGMRRVARRIFAGAIRVPVPPRVKYARLPSGMARQLVGFSVIGALSTIAHLLLYLWLRQLMPALVANTFALLLTAIGNIAANRRFTFGIRGLERALRHQLEGGVAFLVSLSVSTGSLALLHALVSHGSARVETAAVLAGDALATLIRFVLLRSWVFNPRRLRRVPRPDSEKLR
jgi:glycosyltransferase involved in cell wall biosynthesis